MGFRKPRRQVRRFSFKRLLPKRSILIVSEKGVNHYPVSPLWQVLGVCALVGGFSWLSYSTGSYMAASTVLQAQDQQLQSTISETRRIHERFAMLREDLKRLQGSKELTEYDKFVLSQHLKHSEDEDTAQLFLEGNAGLSASGQNRLNARVMYLEQQLALLEAEHAGVLDIIRARTEGKIKELEQIITATGTDARPMARQAMKEIEKQRDDDARGGPLIEGRFQEDAAMADLLARVDWLVALNHVATRMPLANPLPGARTSSHFGYRLDPFTRRSAMHTGLDFVGPSGSRALASAPGTVVYTGRKGAYGNMVEIDHGFGFTTRYGHLQRILVRKGQKLTAGQPLGIQGSTGRSTGSHLHYEVRRNGRALDPKRFLYASRGIKR